MDPDLAVKIPIFAIVGFFAWMIALAISQGVSGEVAHPEPGSGSRRRAGRRACRARAGAPRSGGTGGAGGFYGAGAGETRRPRTEGPLSRAIRFRSPHPEGSHGNL